MNCQRITGGFLSAVLLLAVVLPAMCGQCRAIPAEANCAEEHKSGAKTHDHSSASVNAQCESCTGDSLTLTARFSQQDSGAETYLFGCSKISCASNALARVAVFRPSSPRTSSLLLTRVLADSDRHVLPAPEMAGIIQPKSKNSAASVSSADRPVLKL